MSIKVATFKLIHNYIKWVKKNQYDIEIISVVSHDGVLVVTYK